MGASIRVTQFALNTGTGTQTITLSGEGTCKGYVLFAVQAITNGTEKVEASCFVGMCDEDGNTRSTGMSCEDDEPTTDVISGTNADLMHFLDASAGGADFELQHDSFTTDGFVIDVVNAPSEAWLITAWVFYGSDISTETVALTTDVDDGDEVTVTIGLDPNILIAASSQQGSDADSNVNGRLYFGFGTDKGSPFDQVGIGISSRDNRPTGESANSAIDTRITHAMFGYGASAIASAFEVTTLTSTTLGVTSRNGPSFPSVHVVNFMLINVNGAVDYDVGTFTYPTGTGVVNHTDPGFTPQFVAMASVAATIFLDEDDTGLQEVSAAWYCGAADGTEEVCLGMHDEDGVGTTDTGSYTNTNLVDTRASDGTAEMVGAFDGFTANGWDVDYSDGASSAWTGIYLAIEEEAAPTTAVKDIIGMGVVPFAR